MTNLKKLSLKNRASRGLKSIVVPGKSQTLPPVKPAGRRTRSHMAPQPHLITGQFSRRSPELPHRWLILVQSRPALQPRAVPLLRHRPCRDQIRERAVSAPPTGDGPAQVPSQPASERPRPAIGATTRGGSGRRGLLPVRAALISREWDRHSY